MKIINNVVNKGGSNIKYYDVSGLLINSQNNFDIVSVSIIGKVFMPDKIIISPNYIIAFADLQTKALAIGVDINMIIYSSDLGSSLKSVKEVLIERNLYDVLLSCPELTEEQFYDLTLPTE